MLIGLENCKNFYNICFVTKFLQDTDKGSKGSFILSLYLRLNNGIYCDNSR